MSKFNNFHRFCEDINHFDGLLSVCKSGAEKGFPTKKFIDKVLESAYFSQWNTASEFISVMNKKLSLINETTADTVRQYLSPELKEKRYGSIIKAVKDSFGKLLDKMHYKSAIDLDATGGDIEAIKKRQVIKDLYTKLMKFVNNYDIQISEMDPAQRERLKEEAKKAQQEFDTGIMPFINNFLKTNIDTKYDSYDVILAKIEGSKELGIRKLGGVAKDALARKIYNLLRKEGIEPAYKKKIELLARAIGAEPASLEEKKAEKQEKESRLSAEAEIRKAEAAKRAAELDDARSKGNLRYNPELDKALGLD